MAALASSTATTVADAFTLGTPLGPARFVARGTCGLVFRLDTPAGSWAVKELTWEHPDEDELAFEVAVQRAASQAGVPLPAPLLAPDGAAAVAIGGRSYRAYEWAEVGAPVAAPVPPALAAEVGTLLGTIHALDLPATQPLSTWYTTPPDADEWSDIAGRAEVARAQWAPALRCQLAALADVHTLAVAAPTGTSICCHRDFHRENILPGPSGSLVVLDWENVGPLPASSELAKALVAWCTSTTRPPDTDSVFALVDAYEAVGAPGRIDDAADFAVELSVRANWLAACARAVLGEDDLDAAFAERHLTETLARPFADRLRDAACIVTVMRARAQV